VRRRLKRLPRLFRTTAFRLGVLYLSLFAGSAFAFLAYIYFATAGYLYRTADLAIASEIAQLHEAYDQSGVMGVNARIIAEVARGGRFVYDLSDPAGRRISGVIDHLPEERLFDASGHVRFTLTGLSDDGRLEAHAARGQRVALPHGYTVFVAMDLGQHAHFILQILRAVWGGALIVIALGMIGGIWFARDVDRRIGELNRVVIAVRGGDMSRRARLRGADDEYEGLAQHLNAMLDRIEHQTSALKSAGNALAHDLRTPLTRLRTKLEQAKAASAADVPKALKAAISECDRVLTAFNAMLSLTRLESGAEPVDMAVGDLVPLITDVAELYTPVYEERGITLTVTLPETAVVRHSPSLISQALCNLLDNTLTHATGASSVVCTLAVTEHAVTLSVADDGFGIAPALRAHALERFARLDQSRGKPGIGLGLSLIVAVCDLHGTRFVLTDGLPRADGVGLRAEMIFPKLQA
jgi:signal transduction histidine kinase